MNALWTQFTDMMSGGYEKLGAEVIWIEAGEEEAIEVFKQVFDRDPLNITCQCCGDDYFIAERKFEPKDNHFIFSRKDIEKLTGNNGD